MSCVACWLHCELECVLCALNDVYLSLTHHFGTVRFISYDDLHWFERAVNRVVSEELNEDLVEVVQHTHLYMDFMRYKCISRHSLTRYWFNPLHYKLGLLCCIVSWLK